MLSKTMKEPISIISIFFLFLILIKIVLSTLVPYPMYMADERQYFDVAKSFLKEGKFLDEGENSRRYPIYSLFISPVTIFDVKISNMLIKVLNSIASSSVIFPIWLICREFLDRKKSFFVILLSAFIPEIFAYTFTIMSENLFYPLFMFSIYFIMKSFTEKDKKWKILGGIFIGLTILTRPIGLFLLISIPLVILIKFFINMKNHRKTPIFSYFLDNWILFIFIFITISPWFIRNACIFGTDYSGILGYGKISEGNIVNFTPNLFLEIFRYGLINIGYLVFSTFVVFFSFSIILAMNIKKYKNDKLSTFVILSWTISIILISYTTIFSFTNASGTFIGVPNKIMGRYISTIISLFIIMGFIGMEKYKAKLIMPLIISCFFILFLPTNSSIASFDTLSTLPLFIPEKLNTMNILPFSIPNFTVKIIIFSLIFTFYKTKKIHWKNIFPISFCFFLFLSMLATMALHVGSIDAKEYMEFALWTKDNLPKNSVIIFDVKENDPENEFMWIVESMKFYTDNEIIIGDINILDENADYIISKHKLNFPLISELTAEEGIFTPKTETIFLYKK